jgi:polar amino acid transport system permease protein
MLAKNVKEVDLPVPMLARQRPSLRERLRTIPWWLVAIFGLVFLTTWAVTTQPAYSSAFGYIKDGLSVTMVITLISFSISTVAGLFLGLARVSNSVFWNNVSTFYVEVIRGIPMLVLIFFIALVLIPGATLGIKNLAPLFQSAGFTGMASSLQALEASVVPMNIRAIIALSITYSAFLAEIFRAGIQSVDAGQMEAARSQGMTYSQAMRYIVLPQALRNILPALGNDFISLLKDSSLVSILAVRDITQVARLYAGSTFEYNTTYTTLAVMYLFMTIMLSFVVKYFERRLNTNAKR